MIRSESITPLALFSKNRPTALAERRAAQENVFLREVDDALREDDAARLLRRYGMPAGVAIVQLLAGLAGWMVWTNHVNAAAGATGEALTLALDNAEAGRLDPAKTALDQISASHDASTGYGAAARLVAAGVALDRKHPDDAIKIYRALAADAQVPQVWRDLATVRAVAVQFDTLAPQAVIAQLKSLAVPGNAWFGSAGEMTAIAHIKLGHKAEAGAVFAAMAKDTGVPDSLRRRARQLAEQAGVEVGDAPVAFAPAQ